MRILKISGENLAALGAFTLDLAAPPLRDAGLFCITGPTGAGKSTLLDAMCLALYNRIPRQIERSGISLTLNQTDTMALSDSRQIVRHGAISAFAEVEFSVNAVIYRASWRVERARRQAKGKLQDPRLLLENLTTQQIISDGGRRSTLADIERLLGLSFEQFCRSVLLAQGDFALFLRARKDERAELLEKLTGSEIYSRVSIEVYRRFTVAAQAASALRGQIDGIVLWNDEQQAAAHAELAAMRQQQTQTSQRLAQNAVELTALEQAELANQAFASAQQALGALLGAAPSISLQTALSAATTLRDEMGVRIEQALVLNTRIEAEERHFLHTLGQLAAAEQAMQALAQQQQVNLAAQAQINAQRAVRQQWLEQHPAAAVWAARGAQLSEQILTAARDVELDVNQRQRIAAQHAQLAALDDKQLHQRARVDSANVVLSAAAKTAALASDALNAMKLLHPADTRALCRRELNAQQLKLAQCQALSERAQRLLEQQLQCSAAEQDCQVSIKAHERAVAVLTATLAAQQATLADRLLDEQQAQAAAELAARRPELLQPDQPCPLCGSHEHPAATHPAPANSVLQRARAAHAAAALALRAGQQQHSAAREALVSARQLAASTASERARLNDELTQLQQQWDAQRIAQQPPQAGSAAAAAWLRQLSENTALELQAIERVDHQEQQLVAALTAAQSQLSQAQRLLSDAQDALNTIGNAVQQLRESHVALEREQAGSAARVAQSLDMLNAVLATVADWQTQLAQTPERLAQNVEHLAKLWVQHTESLNVLEREGQQLQQQQGQLEANSASAGQNLVTLVQQRLEQDQALAALRQALDTQTGGSSIASLQRQLEAMRVAINQWQHCENVARTAQSLAPEGSLAAAQAQREQLQLALNALAENCGALGSRIEDNLLKARERVERLASAKAQQQLSDEWEALNSVVGSADGKKFRTFAQNLTLDLLLNASNHYLQTLRPRYALQRIVAHDMEIAVLDHELGDELRGVHTLSGGETFLVSLALALGLSALSAQRVEIESLFIDEGFGALDPLALEDTLELLDRVQAQGRQIGLVSHIGELAERVGVRVAVVPQTLGLSRVVIGL